MNRNSSRICGRNTTTAPTPAMTPSTSRLFKSPGGIRLPTTSPEPIHAGLQRVHRDAREGEDALEHQRHDRHEDQRAPDLVRQDAVQLVAEGFARRREFGGDGRWIAATRA